MPKRLFYILCSLFIGFSGIAQTTDVYRSLLKRYGTVSPWGNGFIIKANHFYGFADRSGHMVLPVNCLRFDTLFHDRASVLPLHGNFSLIDADGHTIAYSPGGYRDYYVVNRKKRILGVKYEDGRGMFCNDKGNPLSYNHSGQALGEISSYNGSRSYFGIINRNSDTILMSVYDQVSFNKNRCSGVRNDTAFVYSLDGRCLFNIPRVHGCKVLHNDFLALEKYGVLALADKKGRLITGFRYFKIQSLGDPDSLGRANSLNKYFIVAQGQMEGLVDTAGTEILPMIYDRLTPNINGWFILNKYGHDKEELVDQKFKKALASELYNMDFVDKRYVRVEVDPPETDNDDDDNDMSQGEPAEKTYDMVQKKFVKIRKTNQAQGHQGAPASQVKEPTADFINSNVLAKYHRDSMVINHARSRLLRKNGLWGVCSVTGDTILPFIYDTVGEFGYQRFFVGRNGRYGYLDWEGQLATPVEFEKLPQQITSDSLAFMDDRSVYSIKGWHVNRVDVTKEKVVIPFMAFRNGLSYVREYSAIKKGVYNRKLERLGEYVYPQTDYPDFKRTGLVTISDSLSRNISIVDTTGRTWLPWMKRPPGFWFYENFALALNDTGKADVLYRFEKNGLLVDTVWAANHIKKQWVYGLWSSNDHWNQDASKLLVLEKPGYGKVLIHDQKVFFVQDAQNVKIQNQMILARIGSRWSAYDREGRQVLPAEYDSIDVSGYDYLAIFKNGKEGIYDHTRKKIFAPVYDSVHFVYSLRQHFFTGYLNGEAIFMNDRDQVIARGWKNVRSKWVTLLGGVPAQRNGHNYKLYPTLGDSLVAEPDEGLPDGISILDNLYDGTAIVTKEKKQGVYDLLGKKWIIQPHYYFIKKEDENFAAYGEPEHLAFYSRSGMLRFTAKGRFHDPHPVNSNQWLLYNPYGDMVVNSKGKIIVPPDFESIYEMRTPQRAMYEAVTKEGKHAIYDSTGKLLIAPLFDYYVSEALLPGGFFAGPKDHKYCLVSPRGKIITGFLFDDIFSAHIKPLSYDRDFENLLAVPPGSKFNPRVDPRAFFIVTKQSAGQPASFGILDTSGRVLLPLVYDSIRGVVPNGSVIVKKDKRWGLVSLSNKAITGFKYDRLDNFIFGKALFRRGDQEGYLFEDGKEELLPERKK